MLTHEALKSRPRSASEPVDVGGDDDADSDQLDADGMDIDPGHADEDDDEAEDDVIDETAAPRAITGRIKQKSGRAERLLTPAECRAHLRLLFTHERPVVSALYSHSAGGKASASADMFFMDVVPVAPTRFRPPAKMGDITFEHTQNQLLGKIITTSYRLRDLNATLRQARAKDPERETEEAAHTEEQAAKTTKDLITTLVQLQIDVNSFMDSNKNPAPTFQGKLPPQGVKQILEKKEGLFRKNMMVRPSPCPPHHHPN